MGLRRSMTRAFVLTFISILVGLGLYIWFNHEVSTRDEQELPFDVVTFDLDSIKKRGKLILLTENSASTYYLYKNQKKGFDYELVKAFAKHIGVGLEVKTLDDVDEMFKMLNSGEGDIIASNLTVTPKRSAVVNFTESLYQTRQILAQRKFPLGHPDSLYTLVTDSSGLSQIPITVHRYSAFYERLEDLQRTMGKLFVITDAPGSISTDDLLRLANAGEIHATITDENLLHMGMEDYPELDMSYAVSEDQEIAWAVRKTSPQLLKTLNGWLQRNSIQKKVSATYAKYFSADEPETPSMVYIMPKLQPGAISPYDSLFKAYAPQINWDWRMLAALAFQESRFNPNAQSRSGAFGLMQLMPETAVRFGCSPSPDAECSIQASVKYLKYLQSLWRKKVPNEAQRNKFILASYNIGQGHVLDAQNLARELGLQDTVWNGHVAEALLLKQQEKYYSMPVVKHGYCYAKEPYQFVGKIEALFEHYKNHK
jgi:membrane-bound lytic murein transglycosylase F